MKDDIVKPALAEKAVSQPAASVGKPDVLSKPASEPTSTPTPAVPTVQVAPKVDDGQKHHADKHAKKAESKTNSVGQHKSSTPGVIIPVSFAVIVFLVLASLAVYINLQK
jgi:cobalamin biosynthesis Mg chelatase CobN